MDIPNLQANTSVDIVAELSDGGSLMLQDLFPESAGDPINNNDDANGVLALDFVADGPGQMLTLTLTVGTVYDTNNGYGFGLGALAVSPIPEPSSAFLMSLATALIGMQTFRFNDNEGLGKKKGGTC
jgi:hypothetical protein